MSSSIKKIKMEPSLTAERSLEPTGTFQLYKLLPRGTGATLYHSPRFYPILPYVGWSYLKELFQHDRSKEASHIFALSDEDPGVGAVEGTCRASNLLATGESPGFLPTKIVKIKVYAPDSNNPTEWLRFVFILPYSRQVPPPEPTPVISIISLELVTGSGYKCDIELTVTPGFLSLFDGTWDSGQGGDRFFHGLLDKNHPQWSRELGEFLIRDRELPTVPTIKIKGVQSTPVIPKGFEVTPQIVLIPFLLLDKENKRYSCHREILKGQWPFLREKLEEIPTMNKMRIEGGSATVDVILHHFYYPQKSLPPINSFVDALDLLKVAHQLEIPKLLAHAVDTLREKIDLAESTQLMELYLFLRQLKFKIQIFCKLWSALVISMTDRIVNEWNGFDANVSGSILCVEAFTEDGYFNLKLLQELARALKYPEDAELNDEDKRSCAEQAINCFKDFVLEMTLSKLKTNNIQL